MTDLSRRADVVLAPMVIDVPSVHSPLDDEPPCWSPLDEGTALRWTPATTREIAASIDRARRRRWWPW